MRQRTEPAQFGAVEPCLLSLLFSSETFMPAPRKRANDQILPFEPPVEMDDAALESLLHPTFDECDDEYWEALIPDDDYEAMPEEGDFWFDQEAA